MKTKPCIWTKIFTVIGDQAKLTIFSNLKKMRLDPLQYLLQIGHNNLLKIKVRCDALS